MDSTQRLIDAVKHIPLSMDPCPGATEVKSASGDMQLTHVIMPTQIQEAEIKLFLAAEKNQG